MVLRSATTTRAVRSHLGKLQETSALLVLLGRSPAQVVPREREYIFHSNMLQMPVGGRGKPHPANYLGCKHAKGGDAEKEVAEDTQDYNRKGILFQPHHSRRVLRGGAPRQVRGTAEASDTSGGSDRSRHNGSPGPCALTLTQTAGSMSVNSGA
jgi:hypothetical protein